MKLYYTFMMELGGEGSLQHLRISSRSSLQRNRGDHKGGTCPVRGCTPERRCSIDSLAIELRRLTRGLAGGGARAPRARARPMIAPHDGHGGLSVVEC